MDHGASRIWISDVTIISPENLDHIVEGSVLIENGRIVSIERKKGTKKPLGTTVVSGQGQFLIPGLIDSHVHLASVPGMQFEMSFDPAEGKPEMIKEYFKQLPRSYLYFGYTTLVDLAVIDSRVLDDFRQTPLHPDLYDCGQSLTFANGYPMSFAPPATTLVCVPPATSAITGAKAELWQNAQPLSLLREPDLAHQLSVTRVEAQANWTSVRRLVRERRGNIPSLAQRFRTGSSV